MISSMERRLSDTLASHKGLERKFIELKMKYLKLQEQNKNMSNTWNGSREVLPRSRDLRMDQSCAPNLMENLPDPKTDLKT